MKDSQGNLVLGRTRWRRFAAVVVPATIAVSAVMGGIASGAIPMQMHVSGQTAMLSADKLDATGFSQWGGTVETVKGQQIPVAISQIAIADITNLCQSVKVPGTPLVLTIRGGTQKGKPVRAENLIIALDYLSGDATFENIRIGTDASELTEGGTPPDKDKLVGMFGQEADTAVIDGLNQRFYSTFAAKFHLTNMTLSLKADGVECFKLP
ncbi:MAG TPA: DUF6230 family protein [Candidatus Limnocylindrales bacterium]